MVYLCFIFLDYFGEKKCSSEARGRSQYLITSVCTYICSHCKTKQTNFMANLKPLQVWQWHQSATSKWWWARAELCLSTVQLTSLLTNSVSLTHSPSPCYSTFPSISHNPRNTTYTPPLTFRASEKCSCVKVICLCFGLPGLVSAPSCLSSHSIACVKNHIQTTLTRAQCTL